jgi:hypothetical protein
MASPAITHLQVRRVRKTNLTPMAGTTRLHNSLSVLHVGSKTAGRDLVNLLLPYILEIAICLVDIQSTDR